jgi:hypothetical protein
VVTTSRAGGVRLGCLLGLLILAAAIYYGVGVGEMYMRYYRFEDAFKQEVRFAGHHTDQEIKRRLRDVADSLGLPEEAKTVTLKRKPHHILIWNEYYDHVDLPFVTRDFYFNPNAEGDL